MINTPTDGATAQTGAYLMVAILVAAGVVSFHPGHFIIFNMQTKCTAATTVDGTGTPDHFFVGLLYRCFCTAQGKRQRKTACSQRQRTYRGRFNECSAADPTICSFLDITHSLFFIVI